MSPYSCFLIGVVIDGLLHRVALKVKSDLLKGDCREFPMEPENRAQLAKFLPSDMQVIVSVESIIDCYVVEEKT